MENHTITDRRGVTSHSFLYNGRLVRIACETTSRIDESLRAGHLYEHKMLGYIARTAKSGAFVDVGGNCGQHSIFFALFCPSTKVTTFEPFPEHCKLIMENIANNNLMEKVRLYPIGLSSQLDVFETKTNSAVHARRYMATCARLDDVIDMAVSVVKLDAEGMELEILKGARNLLRRYQPALYIEAQTDEYRGEISEYLSSFGYKMTNIRFGSSLTYEFVAA